MPKLRTSALWTPQKKNLLLGLNNNEYQITAKLEAKKDGPISYKAPDDNGVLTDFNYYLTQILIVGTKQGNDNLGGKIVRARVALSIITKSDGTFYDCTVDANDPKRLCQLLGGKYDISKTPQCLFTKLPVATDWSKFQTNNQDIFPLGALYGENMLFLGDRDSVKKEYGFRGANSPNTKGLLIGGLNDIQIALGQGADGKTTGLAFDHQNHGFLSLFVEPWPTGTQAQLYPRGLNHFRSYDDRPVVFSTCSTASCSETMAIMTKTTNPMVVSHGPFFSASSKAAEPYIKGTKTFPGLQNAGVGAVYEDGKWTGLGRAANPATGDAMGLFFMNDTNLPTRPNPTLGGVYWSASEPGRAGVPGALVVKAYGKNDLIFQNYQPTNQTLCGSNGELCTPMLIRGDTGNVAIGGGFSTPHAKLTVSGVNNYSGLFRNTVVSANPDNGDFQTAKDNQAAYRTDGTNYPGFVTAINGWAVGMGRAGNGGGGVGLGITQGAQARGTIFYETNPSYDRLRIHAYEKNIFLDVSNNANSMLPLVGLFAGTRNVGIDIPVANYKLDVAGDINSSGVIRIGGASICTAGGCTSSSDERLKTNITPLENSLAKILQLHGKTYTWKDPEKYGRGPQLGLIAQEVEKVYPEVVTTDEKTNLKRVSYPHLIAPLIEAFRSLVEQITHLEKIVTEVVSRIADLTADVEKYFSQQRILKDKIITLEQENATLKGYLCQQDPKAPFCTTKERSQ